MIKRSELKKGMYVRMSNILDDDSYWSRLMKGRYFEVDTPASEPDDSSWWSMTSGTVIMFGMNYVKGASNDNMEAVSSAEQERIRYVLSHKDEFVDIFRIGRKVERTLDSIEDILDEIGIYRFELWDVSDTNHFIERVQEDFYIDNDGGNISKYKGELSDLKELFQELESLLDEMTRLEDIHIRQFAQK